MQECLCDYIIEDMKTVGWLLTCIGAPKAKEDRIICIRSKHLSNEEEIDRHNT